MTTNLHFNNYDAFNEQILTEDLVIEIIQMYGHDMTYLPRTNVATDDILNEVNVSSFEKGYTVEMYIENVDAFDGDGDLFTKFGLDVDDEMTLAVSRARFGDITGTDIPKEGDLLYFPISGGLFEIRFVEDENPFYHFGKLYTFKLICRLFKYGHEEFNTNIAEIDAIDTAFDELDTTTDPFADNTIIETEADDIIIFDEKNPFGEF